MRIGKVVVFLLVARITSSDMFQKRRNFLVVHKMHIYCDRNPKQSRHKTQRQTAKAAFSRIFVAGVDESMFAAVACTRASFYPRT